MNYQQLYNNLITNAREKDRSKKDGYYENHHIIPRCLKGDDSTNNLILLTLKEHYIAHRLLCKIHPENDSLKYALFAMTLGRQLTSSQYEIAKKTMIEAARSRIGSKNPFYNKSHSKQTKENLSNIGKERNYSGKNNPNYGKFWNPEQKENLSKKNKGKLSGDKNPARRIEVRDKISKSKMGSNNSNSKKWKLKNKTTGEIVEFIGGIKKFLSNYPGSYLLAIKQNRDKNWTLL